MRPHRPRPRRPYAWHRPLPSFPPSHSTPLHSRAIQIGRLGILDFGHFGILAFALAFFFSVLQCHTTQRPRERVHTERGYIQREGTYRERVRREGITILYGERVRREGIHTERGYRERVQREGSFCIIFCRGHRHAMGNGRSAKIKMLPGALCRCCCVD